MDIRSPDLRCPVCLFRHNSFHRCALGANIMKWFLTALIFGPITTLFTFLITRWVAKDLAKANSHADFEYWYGKTMYQRQHGCHATQYDNPGLEQGI